MPHYVASDLGLHCLPEPFYRFPSKNGLRIISKYLDTRWIKILDCFGKQNAFYIRITQEINAYVDISEKPLFDH